MFGLEPVHSAACRAAAVHLGRFVQGGTFATAVYFRCACERNVYRNRRSRHIAGEGNRQAQVADAGPEAGASVADLQKEA
jgi:hypothetical protein